MKKVLALWKSNPSLLFSWLLRWSTGLINGIGLVEDQSIATVFAAAAARSIRLINR